LVVSKVFTPSAIRVSVVLAVVLVFAVGGAALLFASQGPAPQRRDFRLQIAGDRMTPDRMQAYQGDTLSITIEADRTEEIHLHGYDKHFFSGPGQPATLTFPGDLTGSFVLEIEATSTPLGTLQVQPRGGLLGLGRPADQSSTTVVRNQFAGITRVTTTSSYNLSLEIGTLQPMYTQAQVSAQHPRVGEVLFSGQMVMPPGMAGMESMTGMSVPPSWRHLEVHFFLRSTGDVVRDLAPVITITDAGSGRSQTVSIVTMQGLTDGPKDFHYGNNVELPGGRYRVNVAANGEMGSFDIAM
jgi:hypothetical protein